MTALRATYRLQLRPGFGLAAARSLLPYLDRLGISHVYLSPILKARSGSTHGYDVVDPTCVNPELGDVGELRALARAARERDMGIVLDIVPNHMATGRENPFWEDMLKHGPRSPYARWFDVDWGRPGSPRHRRIFIPVLGERLRHVVGRNELRLNYEAGEFRLSYFEASFPLDPATIPRILRTGLAETRRRLTQGADELRQLLAVIAQLRALPSRGGAEARADPERGRRAEAIEQRLQRLYDGSPAIRTHVDAAVAAFVSGRGSTARLRRLHNAQAYRLAYWRRAAREINYRRFFTISHLIALRQEDPAVFSATHARLLEWVKEGFVHGLRIDHVDGLRDPRGYLERLRAALAERLGSAAPEFPLWVEKILARDERLSEDWPIEGTTGYDFLAEVEDVFIDPEGYESIDAGYRSLVGRAGGFSTAASRGKRRVLNGQLAADVDRLAERLHEIAGEQGDRVPARGELAAAIREIIVALPVYRTYVSGRGAAEPADRAYLERALADARASGHASDTALALLEDVLLRGSAATAGDRLAFIERFQQICGPAAAKGVEDTALYVYAPLASRNEVGGEPDAPLADATSGLHRANSERAERWPRTLLCVSTHDTKRSADVRSRLNVLSELPDRWLELVRGWRRANRSLHVDPGGRSVPDAGTEYHLYQTLVAVWPPPDAGRLEAPTMEAFGDRLSDYMQKAVREAKLYTSWVEPDAEYEAAVRDFLDDLLGAEATARFRAELEELVSTVRRPGFWNALARTLVHLIAPGVPDIYQGDELWNLSLVDPDNRRPVDFTRNAELLDPLIARATGRERETLLSALVAGPEDGRAKLYVIWRALQARRERPALFNAGDYRELALEGSGAGHLLAFARSHGGQHAIAVVPRLPLQLTSDPSAAPLGPDVWHDTAVHLPPELAGRTWSCALTGEAVAARTRDGGEALLAADVLTRLPVALLLDSPVAFRD